MRAFNPPPTSDRRSATRRVPVVTQVPGRIDAQPWSHRLPKEEWEIYQRVMQEARGLGVTFAFGGAFATAVYTGELRNTKDFDFYVLPSDREAMVEATRRAGLTDHFERLQYDRSWIYRASEGDVLVDIIWAMANHRADVDASWLSRGPLVEIRGERVRAIPIEELIWSKLYVLQRDRTDWGDVLNLIAAQAASIDWDHLLSRLGPDTPLLAAVLGLFAWLTPGRAQVIPVTVWQRTGVRAPQPAPEDPADTRARAALIDSRPWFRPAAG
jgi:Nucleotidyl transferase of unknown function (DUF2204)